MCMLSMLTLLEVACPLAARCILGSNRVYRFSTKRGFSPFDSCFVKGLGTRRELQVPIIILLRQMENQFVHSNYLLCDFLIKWFE